MKYTVLQTDTRWGLRFVWFKYRTPICHREDDLPAIEWEDGGEYLFDGVFHRENGPARDLPSVLEYYFRGELIECDSFEEFKKIIKLQAFS